MMQQPNPLRRRTWHGEKEYIKNFLATIPQYPFQEGSSLNAAGINYQSLKVAGALKRLEEIESLSPPR